MKLLFISYGSVAIYFLFFLGCGYYHEVKLYMYFWAMVVHLVVYSCGLMGYVYDSSFMYILLENRLWLHNFVYGLHGSMCMCLLMGLCAGVRIMS